MLRLDSGDGHQLAVGAVEGQQGADVHVADAVAVGDEEAVGRQVLRHAGDAPGFVRLQAGVDQRHRPLRMLLQPTKDDLAGSLAP
jgi:hypothetical protein